MDSAEEGEAENTGRAYHVCQVLLIRPSRFRAIHSLFWSHSPVLCGRENSSTPPCPGHPANIAVPSGEPPIDDLCRPLVAVQATCYCV